MDKINEFRAKESLAMCQRHIKGDWVLDLGAGSEMSDYLRGVYNVHNTEGDLDDLDYDLAWYHGVTAFEILEHLVNPLGVLKNIQADTLIASVPLATIWNKTHDGGGWDRHYHEFLDWQFDWLLEKAGWKIVERKKLRFPILSPTLKHIKFRFIPRWYLVAAKRL